MSATQNRAKSIFLNALDIAAPEERLAFVESQCQGNELLRNEVDELIRHEESLGSFLESATCEFAFTTDQHPMDEQSGTLIGPYKLLEQIGEGGFGVVYLAEQRMPVRRKVALKIIKPGMDTRQMIGRFQAERQALALMDHPNIAKVLDAGTMGHNDEGGTRKDEKEDAPSDSSFILPPSSFRDAGRPYFVMELVHGIPITDYCDECSLTTRERLELFVTVCLAVQHAHQKGIIHRDIKPTNVLVAMQDGRATPKIIDFGVAKAIDQRLTEHTVTTAFAQMVGTPLYMSPEQAELSALGVDTRSDIYSLGVLLYELLTGTTPFEKDRLKSASYDELRRIIREEEPPRPSARISTLAADQGTTVAEHRRTDMRCLRQTVRGELDWIVMKCLEKDRNRRYDSVGSLARDIERYLHDEPVQACPPSATYRIGKFVRRHKVALATAGLFSAALSLALIGLTIGTMLVWHSNNEARRISYFQRVALAEREWTANNFKRADELLALCPTDLRGWEWNYVKRLRCRQIPPLPHESSVADCAVSPDGTLIVSLDWTGHVHFWDAATGQQIRSPIRGHESSAGVVSDVMFSPDGRQFTTTGWDNIKVWDTGSGEQLHTWKSPAKDSIHGIAYKAAGQLIACVCAMEGDEYNVSIWEPVADRELFALPQVNASVLDLAVSPDDQILALACLDNTVRLVDPRSGKAKRNLQGSRPFWCVSFSRDGSLVAAGTGGEGEQDSGTVAIWEVASGRERTKLTGHGAQCLTFSPDGKRLATGGTDQAVKIWDIASGQEILTLRGHTDFVQGIGFTPDGARLVSSGERSVHIWDGRQSNNDERFGDDVVTLLGHSDSVNLVAFRPHSAELATASGDGTIKTWDTQTWRELRSVRPTFDVLTALAFSPQGERLAVSGYLQDQRASVVYLDANTGEDIQQLGDLSGADIIAFGTDGRHLAVGNEYGLVTIFDVESNAAGSRFQAPGKFPFCMTFSPEDRLLAVCQDNNITIWETATGREIDASPLKHRGLIYGIVFSPDGQFLASGGWDRTVRVWDTTTWKQVQVLIDADAAIQGLAFSPDGSYLAWGATDSAVKIWNRATDELHMLRGHLGYLRCVAFSPDGKWLASGSEDGTAKIWKVPHDDSAPSMAGD